MASLSDSIEEGLPSQQESNAVDSLTTTPPTVRTLHISVEGMMCQKNCGTTVGNALKQVEGVLAAEANYKQARALAVLESTDDAIIEEMIPELVEEVEDVGFDAALIHDVDSYLQSLAPEDLVGTHSDQEPLLNNNSPLSTKKDIESFSIEPSNMNRVIVLSVGGMSCAVCTGRVESCLSDVPGVVTASVVLATQRAIVEIDEEEVAERDELSQTCCEAVQQAGYSCNAVELSHDLRQDAMQLEQARLEEGLMWRKLLIFSASLLFPMVLIMTGALHLGRQSTTRAPSIDLWVMFTLSTVVQCGAGKRYYQAAWKGWTNGRILGMDFLVVLGTTASYVYSFILFAIQLCTRKSTTMKPSFLTGAMLLTFVTLGKFLESYARGKTADAVHKLMELQPSVASRVMVSSLSDDMENIDISALVTEEVTIGDIQCGDYVRVLPGGQIPADGVLVAVSSKSSGGQEVSEAFVDESAFSGEPFPVSKTIGDHVYGSCINQLSVLVVKVTAAGSETFLSKIVRLVEDAQRHKAPIQAYADRLASVFAPAVIGVACITFFAWLLFDDSSTSEERFFAALMSSISVVVVACPCALGLATPTAVMVGTGVGATQGILIKGGAVLEQMHSVDTVIFDKTGTLTSGKAKLSDQITYTNDVNYELLAQNIPPCVAKNKVALWLAVCAEAQSEHPLARALIEAAKDAWGGEDLTGAADGVHVDSFNVQPGRGVECRVSKTQWGGRMIRVGSREWCKEPIMPSTRIEADDTTGDKDVAVLRDEGKIAIYVSILDLAADRRHVIGVFGIHDTIKPEARSAVSALKAQGVDVWMCTGDDRQTALAVARAVGINEANVCAGVKPQEKADLVTRLQKANNPPGRQSRDKNRRNDYRKVAMIADGVNDSIALARADAGIAIGAGTEIALDAADVVLVRSNLHDVVVAIHLSCVVFRRILLNFFLALCYNVIAVPFAAGLLYPLTDFHLPPSLAGFMMACSSVSVVTSSLLLRRYKRPIIEDNGVVHGTATCLERLGGFLGIVQRSRYVNLVPEESREIV